MEDITESFEKLGVVPVVVLEDAKDAVPLATALVKGGLPCAEVTFRTEAAEESIRLMMEQFPKMLVGAGTVLTVEQVDAAVRAGAKFIVSPGFDAEIVDYCIKNEIPAMFAAGIPSFKMYMTYPAMMIGDQDLFSALLELKKYGGIAGVHCENAGVIDALIAQHKAEGKTAPSSHPECRPNPLEAEAVAHLLRIAEVADVPIVIVHLSTKEALLEVMHARERGQKVYVETCPHYLLLDDSVYDQEDYSASARYICAPPMRKKEDQAVLWKALANGSIQTVSTDHCSFTLKQKDAGRGDFTKIPGGLPGVETRGELLYTAGVAEGRITKEQMCALLSENPAKLYGAYPRKGVLAAGSDADIVVYDPAADTTISAADQISAAGYTPFEGFRTHGSIAQVWLRGQLAVERGEILTGAVGEYIPRRPGAL